MGAPPREQYYQAVRRCWRFGQTREVRVHIITSTAEGQVVANIKRKEADAQRMASEMVKHMHSINEANIKGTGKTEDAYVEDMAKGENFTIYLGDCVEVCKKIPTESVGFSIFSPPFASLYTYSASDRDMGNCTDYEEFSKHFEFLSDELFRVTQPGRLLSCHCMSNPGDTILSPFAGIGSEGFVALQTGRKFIGIELKASYWKQAVENCIIAESESDQMLIDTNAA